MYIIWILTAREGNLENSHPEKTNVDRGEAEDDIGFRGVTVSHLISRAVNNYYIILVLNVD